ncbi:MAG: hypothetical protein ACR2L2_03945 [Acidobacteriota bacterium]
MKDIAERLRTKEQEMATEKGPFLLFALFLREDAPDLWDLVVSAPWIEADKGQALAYIASKVGEALSLDEITKLSRIALIDRSNPALEAVQQAIHIEHGLADLQDSVFFGIPIRHAYIVTSRREAA